MKVSAKAQAAHAEKIIAAVKVLMEYGLPDPVSSFYREIDQQQNRPPRDPDPAKVVVPLPANDHMSRYRGITVDLSAAAPDKILLLMFKAAWLDGFSNGQEQANKDQTEAMLAAFPKLKDTIRELAEEAADKKIDEFKERFQN